MAELTGRKPPNKVRTGGENEGDGGAVPVVSHTPKIVILLETSIKNGLARSSIFGSFLYTSWGPYGGPIVFQATKVDFARDILKKQLGAL